MKVIDVFFQVSALFYTILIAVVFATQKKLNKIENYVYRGVLVVTFLELLLDIAYHIAYYYLPELMISEILARLFMCSILTWLVTFTFYIYSLVSAKNDGKEMNQEKQKYFWKVLIVLFMLTCALNTIILVLPMNVEITDISVYINGPILYFVYAVIGVTMFTNIFLCLRSKEGLKDKRFAPVHLLNILMLIVLILRVFYPQLPVIAVVISLTSMFIYFTIENPNLALIENLNIATRQAQAATRAKSEFLSSMSHEIRTPLNAIIGFSQALAKENISGSAKDEVKDILMASTELLEVVNGILDVSKLEADKIEIVNNNYSSRELLNEISTLINTRIGSKQIEFKIDVDDNLPEVLYGDSVRLKQILINLLTNAVKYTKEGYVLFQVNFQTIGDKCKIMFKVEDTGIGMTEQDLEHLYTKFQRFDIENNINIAGTGLGMAIIKGLVDLLGGEILVKSEYGKGTTFTVFLEQQISEKQIEELQHNEGNGKVIPFDATGKKVLVVDDNKINLKVAEKLLSGYNLEIELVDNGRECINKILAGEKYDLIFLDIMMPKMKGPEVLQNLKNIMGFNVPVVALTADIISGMEEKYLSLGFDGCLSKPIIEELLYYVLKKYLSGGIEAKSIIHEQRRPVVTRNPKILEQYGVDVQNALEILHDADNYNVEAENYYSILVEKMNKLYEYKNNQDLENYYILVKFLKETAYSLGFNTFSSLAEEHELASNEKRLEFIENNYPKLKMESIRVADVLKKYLGK